jgi:steroid 5-alpha reductase family enzyme
MIAFIGLNALISAACFVVLWLIALRLKDVSFIDSWWALGLGLMGLCAFLEGGPPGPRDWLLLACCEAWALRLGIYLLWRWRRNGRDPRYDRLLSRVQEKRGMGFALASLIYVFVLQAVLQFIVSLPVQLGQWGGSNVIGTLSEMGLGLFLIGFLFEAIADWQLACFKGKPENKGKVLDSGLWKYTRHPNHFGDALVWWGLFLIASESGFVIIILVSPALISFLLTSFSGAPTVEGRMGKRPEYADYIRRTHSFVPWFPKG